MCSCGVQFRRAEEAAGAPGRFPIHLEGDEEEGAVAILVLG